MVDREKVIKGLKELWKLFNTMDELEGLRDRVYDALELINSENLTAFDVLDIISSAYSGKQVYFMQENGIVYGRDECKYMTFEEAVYSMARRVGWDGEVE